MPGLISEKSCVSFQDLMYLLDREQEAGAVGEAEGGANSPLRREPGEGLGPRTGES